MIREVVKFFIKPKLIDHYFFGYKIADIQYYCLRLNYYGVLIVKINGKKVPRKEVYVISTFLNENIVQIELRNIFFNEKFDLRVEPKATIDFKTPYLEKSMIMELVKSKHIYYKRKLLNPLKKKDIFENKNLAFQFTEIASARPLTIISRIIKSLKIKQEKLSIKQEYLLNEIIEQYGETNLPTT